MGIDGIGRGGPPAPVPSGPGKAGGAGATPGKELSTVGEADAAAGVSATGQSEALSKLEAGELSLDEYLNAQVQQATQHLQGRVSAEQLTAIQQTLRAEMSSDPALLELVKRATGRTPGASET